MGILMAELHLPELLLEMFLGRASDIHDGMGHLNTTIRYLGKTLLISKIEENEFMLTTYF